MSLRRIIKQRAIIGILFGIVVAGSSYVAVNANVFGRPFNVGYFTNQLDGQQRGDNVLPAWGGPGGNGRDAFPAGYVNSVPRLLEILKDANRDGGNNQRVTGSAFIVNTMLGRNGPGAGRNVSGADWAELKARLDDRAAKGKINWDVLQSSGGVNSYYATSVRDDAFYNDNEINHAIVIYNDDNSVAYAIFHYCANPVGRPTGLPKAGPQDAANLCKPMRIEVDPRTDYNGNGIPVAVSINGNVLGVPSTPSTINTPQYVTGDVYTVNFNETGPHISGYHPVYDSKGNYIRSDPDYAPPISWSSQIGPCYDYRLTPSVITDRANIESGSVPTTVYRVVDNQSPTNPAGTTKTPPDVDWRLTKMIYAPGTQIDTAARDSNNDPCGTFSPAGRTSCTTVLKTVGAIPPGHSQTPFDYSPESDLVAGSHVCFVTSVSNPNQEPFPSPPDPAWRHSEMKCMVVSKKPKIQVLGGDVRVGGMIDTSTSDLNVSGTQKLYGSWVEYGALSTGLNNHFASGSGLHKGGASSQSAWSNLTFANVGGYGNFGLLTRNPGLVGQYTSGNSGSSAVPNAVPNIGTLASGTYTAGDLSIGTSDIGQDNGVGKSIIIYATGTVTITGDIRYVYNGGDIFTNMSQIPQLVIVAKHINIVGVVKRIDAWLMTSGSLDNSISTCSDQPGAVYVAVPLVVAQCNLPLVINGPVVTSHLYLRRTAGAEDANHADNPSEVFNLRPDAYLWAQIHSASAGKAETVYTSELPPRF